MDNSTKWQSNRGRRRPVSLVLREEDCDGLISFLETLQYGAESKLMRAILIDWFQEQLAVHGANASTSANELIQKYEIIFLQQKHGIQFSNGEHQIKKREIRTASERINQRTEGVASSSVKTGSVDTRSGAEVEDDAVPALIDPTPVALVESPLPLKHSLPPPAPTNVSGEVDVDGILGL